MKADKFDAKGLTEIEFCLLLPLAESEFALNTYNIYAEGCYGYIQRKEKVLPRELEYASAQLPVEEEVDKEVYKNLKATRRESFFRSVRHYGLDIPTYKRVGRILEKLSSIGCVKKRETGTKKGGIYWYLEDDVRSEILKLRDKFMEQEKLRIETEKIDRELEKKMATKSGKKKKKQNKKGVASEPID